MAESLTIARPYAEAVFNLAREMNVLPAWSDALSRLAAVAGTKLAQELMTNPGLAPEKIAGVIGDVAGQLSTEQSNFVRVLAQNERLAVLPEIAQHFETLRNSFEEVLDAQVTSAYPLSQQQLDDVVQTLQARYGKKVKASVQIDPELIGGVSIRVGDEVTDASVRGKLAQLAGALKV